MCCHHVLPVIGLNRGAPSCKGKELYLSPLLEVFIRLPEEVREIRVFEDLDVHTVHNGLDGYRSTQSLKERGQHFMCIMIHVVTRLLLLTAVLAQS